MMANYKWILSLLILSLIYSCNRDNEIKIDPDPDTPIDPEYYYRSSVSGNTFDERFDVLANVKVSYRDSVFYSDNKGRYFIKDNILKLNGEIFKYELPGYFTQYAFLKPELNDVTNINVNLLKEENPSLVNPAFEFFGTFYNDFLACSIMPNSIVDENAEQYEKDVFLFLKAPFIEQSSSCLDATIGIPNSYYGIDNSGKETVICCPIYSFLFELRDEDNAPLKLSKPVEILATSLCSLPCGDEDGELVLWHFDETTGMWNEVNKVFYDSANSLLKMEIKDCGYYFISQYDSPSIFVKGKISFSDGRPASMVRIDLINKKDNMLVFTTSAKIDGSYILQGRKGIEAVLRIYDCNNNFEEIDLGVVDEYKELDVNLSPDFSNPYLLELSNIKNRDNIVINRAFVKVEDYLINSRYEKYSGDEVLVLHLNDCDNLVEFFDIDNLPEVKTSGIIDLKSNPNPNPEDFIPYFDLDEYIYAKIDSVEAFASNVFKNNDCDYYCIKGDYNNMTLYILLYKDTDTGIYKGRLAANMDIYDSYCKVYESSETEPVLFEVNEENGFIIGAYSAEIEYLGDKKKMEGYLKIKK